MMRYCIAFLAILALYLIPAAAVNASDAEFVLEAKPQPTFSYQFDLNAYDADAFTIEATTVRTTYLISRNDASVLPTRYTFRFRSWVLTDACLYQLLKPPS